MRTFARLLAPIGPVELFDYPYALGGRRRPDPLPKLIAAHRAALAVLRARHDGPIVLAGKSMGGRVGCHVALVEKVEALVCFGYPLCGGGDRSKLRDQVLLDLQMPILFVQGTRDPLCPLDLLEGVRKRMRAPSTAPYRGRRRPLASGREGDAEGDWLNAGGCGREGANGDRRFPERGGGRWSREPLWAVPLPRRAREDRAATAASCSRGR